MASKVKSFFSTLLKVIGLTAICLLLALIIVWPLWKFAVSNSKFYTITILILILLLVIASIVLRIRRNAKK